MNIDFLGKIGQDLLASSAKQQSELIKVIEESEKEKNIKEYNNPTNQSLRSIIAQNSVQIELLKEQNANLKEQLKNVIKNEQEAKKEAKFNRLWVYISCGIALVALIVDVIFNIIK